MPHFVSTKDKMVENINDMTCDFACVKVSALEKASRVLGDINQMTIGPDSIGFNLNSEECENVENEQNNCNIRSPKKCTDTENAKILTQNGVTFSVKKILLEEELQRKEKVWVEVERHWQNMKENGRVIQENMVRSRSHMARERERKSAEKLAIILAEEERIAEQEEKRRKRELQLHAQHAQEQREKMEREVEEHGKRMKEIDELIRRTVCLRDIFQTSYCEIVRLTKMCKDKNAIGTIYTSYAIKLNEMRHQMEVIDQKIKNGDVGNSDLAITEAIVHQIDEVLRVYRSEIERIDALYEENLNRAIATTKEVNEFGKQQQVEANFCTANNIVSPITAPMDADGIVHNEDKDSRATEPGVEKEAIGTLKNSSSPIVQKPSLITGSESTARRDSPPQYKGEYLCHYIDEESLQRYVKTQEFLENYIKNYKDFLETAATKKFRFECQKAINIPVNAISGISEQHLKDKYDRLHSLLTSKSSSSVGQYVHGAAFCKDTLAKKIVSQGETLVSSKPKMAFAIAAVAVALWNDHADFGELLLAHFYKTCPFTAPIYMPRSSESQSNEEYYKLLGYKYSEDGSIEKQDKFLKRMSGLVRLYASITVTPQRRDAVSRAHPHGLQNAWRWLAATLNCDPRPDISDLYATFILDMLEVTGNALWTAYPLQFKKLLLLLTNQYYPRMQNSGGVSSGPLMRLEEFLKNNLASGFIPPPDGCLPRNFW